MNYKPELGIFGNLKRLYSISNNTSVNVQINKAETEAETEAINAKVDYIAMMTDVELPEAEEEAETGE